MVQNTVVKSIDLSPKGDGSNIINEWKW